MARKFETSDIVSPVKARFSKRSLTHINTAFDELGEDTIKSLIGTYTTNDVLILHGCDVAVTSGAIPGTGTATLSAGAVYYNGRIYKVDANASLATTNPQTLIWQIVETTIAGDPAIFDDGNSYDFHIIEKFRLVAGTAGSGLANYNASTVKYFNFNTKGNTALTALSATNATVTNCSYNLIRTATSAQVSMLLAFSVTDGSLGVGIVLNKIPNSEIIPSSFTSGSINGVFNAINVSTSAVIGYRNIRHGLDPPDFAINADGRIVFSANGSTLGVSGNNIQIVLTFNAKCTI